LKTWIKESYLDLKEGNTIDYLQKFVKETMSKVMPNGSKEVLDLLESQEKNLLNPPKVSWGRKPPKSHRCPTKDKLTLNDIHPEEVARQVG
jgi:hypothetical protein